LFIGPIATNNPTSSTLNFPAGSAVTSYAYAAGPLEPDKAGTTYWYLSDTLGSVRLVTDSTGASPATYAYSAFGSTRKSTGSLANEVRFTGERTDGRQRHYVDRLGRVHGPRSHAGETTPWANVGVGVLY
jgi:hypothetical protein